eukprot:jgi/Bigna1/82232/fgenesh1_pg.89_\
MPFATRLLVTLFVFSVFAAYDPNADYEELMESFDTYPKAHSYDGRGKLGELTLYEIQDFADTIEDPDARDRVEQFASSMEMMLKMMNKNPATTKLNDLRRLAHARKRRNEVEEIADDQDLEQQLKSMMDPEVDDDDDSSSALKAQIAQMKPLMNMLGMTEDDLTEEKIKELMSPESLHKISQQVMGNLGLDPNAGPDGLLSSLLGLDGLGDEDNKNDDEWVYHEWLEGLSEKDQKILNRFLGGEIPETLEDLKSISKSELAEHMKPLTANRIWRHIHLGSGLEAMTSELAEMMDVVEKNPKMKEYSERFMEALTKGGAGSHEEIIRLTQEMQQDPHVKKLTEKIQQKGGIGGGGGGGIPGVDHLKDMLSGVGEDEFKTMLQTMSGMGLPGFSEGMKDRMKDIDMDALKEEYGLMMEALLSGKDLSALELPTIDHLMGKRHDDL